MNLKVKDTTVSSRQEIHKCLEHFCQHYHRFVLNLLLGHMVWLLNTSLILSIDLNLLNLHFWLLYGGCLVCKDLWALWCRLASVVAILSKQGCMCWTVQICMFWILAVDIKVFFLVYWVYLWTWEIGNEVSEVSWFALPV